MAGRVPLVDYLVLDDGEAHLIARECSSCGARFFDRRNACAGC
ncbi:zinc ribbon domain-containing protein, partial [Mycobacterium sp.]